MVTLETLMIVTVVSTIKLVGTQFVSRYPFLFHPEFVKTKVRDSEFYSKF